MSSFSYRGYFDRPGIPTANPNNFFKFDYFVETADIEQCLQSRLHP